MGVLHSIFAAKTSRTPGESRRVAARAMRGAFLCLCLVLLGLSACKSAPAARGDDLEERAPIAAHSEAAQKQFDAAMALLKAGEYLPARDAFRMLQAEYPEDPIATLAEVYIARASMGKIEPQTSFLPEATAAYPRSSEVAQILGALGESDSIDKRIRYGAAAYYALELALRGESEQALNALRDYPSASLSNIVLADDRLAVRSLLLESLWRAGRSDAALDAAARLYQEADALEAKYRGAGNTQALGIDGAHDEQAQLEALAPEERRSLAFLHSLKAFSRERAFTIVERDAEELALQDYLHSKMPFLRALAGWRILEQSLDAEIAENERAGLEDLFNQIAPDLVAIDATSRAAELSQRLAAVGGPKRLAIGFLLPLSGSYRAIGARAMAGALVAMNAFHHASEPEVTLIFEDSQGDPAAIFERFKQQKVLAVAGPLDVQRAQKFAPFAHTHQIPMITLTTESVRAQEGAEDGANVFVFRNFIDAAAEARAAARIGFEQLQDRKAAIVFPDVGYGRVTAQAFAAEFRRLGGQIVAEIAYDRSKSDFSDTATQLAKSGAEAVFLPDSAEKVAEVSAFFANANIWGIASDEKPSKKSGRQQVHYLGTSLWEDPILWRQASSYVEGAVIPVWFSSALTQPETQEFVARFEAIYQRAPSNFEAFSFDTVSWLRALILERGMRRSVGIRDALLGSATYRGVTGESHMGAGGVSQRALRFVTPSPGGFVALPYRAETARKDAQESADKTDAATGAAPAAPAQDSSIVPRQLAP